MSDFKLIFPRDQEELFEQLDENSMILSGGTDLVVRNRVKGLKASKLVSLDKIKDMDKITDEGDAIRIFAKATYTKILSHELVRKEFPILEKTIREIGSTQIRNRGTLVGNIINASPAGDGVLALYLLDAFLVIRSQRGEKTVRIENFIKGPGQTTLEAGEYVHSVIIPKCANHNVHYFKKVGQRKAMAISIASMGAIYTLKKGMFLNLKMAFGSVAPTVIRADEIEAMALGMDFNEETARILSQKAKTLINPITDVRATSEYRKEVTANLVIGMFE
ncbi:MAG: FAD binding domain-containing protein [Thermotogota bacterium]